MLIQQADGRDHPLVRAFSSRVQPVAVVNLPWAIQRKADQNAVLRQPAAPGFVQQGAVGLNGVAELHPAGVGLFGGIAGKPLVEFHPHQGGFAALKGQRAYAFALPQAEINEAVHGGVAHKTKGGELALLGFIGVKAIGAAQVAAAGGRFDEQGKRRHGQSTPYHRYQILKRKPCKFGAAGNVPPAAQCLTLLYRSRPAGASRDEERANPAEKAASCAKVTELQEKCGKTKKADENAHEKKKKKLEDDCANKKTRKRNKHKKR